VIGRESGVEALERFGAGLHAALAASRGDVPLVVVTHGTVIALFVSAHNAVAGLSLWTELSCGSFVVLGFPRFDLVGGVQRLD
jgi:broad specificity phosphatase PhoE